MLIMKLIDRWKDQYKMCPSSDVALILAKAFNDRTERQRRSDERWTLNVSCKDKLKGTRCRDVGLMSKQHI